MPWGWKGDTHGGEGGQHGGSHVWALPSLQQQAGGQQCTASQKQADGPLTVSGDGHSEGRAAVQGPYGGALTQESAHRLHVVPVTDCEEQLLVQSLGGRVTLPEREGKPRC